MAGGDAAGGGLDERLRPYGARGTGATRLLMAGADIQEIAVVTGWSARQASAMTETYAALNPEASDSLLERLSSMPVKDDL